MWPRIKYKFLLFQSLSIAFLEVICQVLVQVTVQVPAQIVVSLFSRSSRKPGCKDWRSVGILLPLGMLFLFLLQHGHSRHKSDQKRNEKRSKESPVSLRERACNKVESPPESTLAKVVGMAGESPQTRVDELSFLWVRVRYVLVKLAVSHSLHCKAEAKKRPSGIVCPFEWLRFTLSIGGAISVVGRVSSGVEDSCVRKHRKGGLHHEDVEECFGEVAGLPFGHPTGSHRRIPVVFSLVTHSDVSCQADAPQDHASVCDNGASI